ncbi:putative ABC-type transport system periplasmic component/surface lipoprotein [Gaiella occulta]|uniref:Putative ABC-type transport system periplasmic component/surface lipoprotein n=1 Tax=Gaiella occulta TaxID=1002870 RepID=A0A7M2Z1V5_9ACTN|nr:BMP family protein [Gaiella occulta]RDI75802.1 putative ABC-type transport system periplasmic component/surface lipoprotein [Gaiella occulta]
MSRARKTSTPRRFRRTPLLAALAALLLAAAVLGGGVASAGQTGSSAKLKVFGAFATPIEEPWDGVIHAALLRAKNAGEIDYSFADDIGYSGDMERVLRQVAGKNKPDIIIGDAFGNEEAVRRVAKAFPRIAFVFGSGGGPAGPNVSVFDNWIHEPAYLLGVLAGSLTKTNKVGIVAGFPVPEVNRLANAFTAGAHSINKKAVVKVTFINSWFDPATAKEAALAQVGAGVDAIYAERAGVIEAAVQKDVFAFGNMSDQRKIGPRNVVSSAVWNMSPTVEYVIKQVKAGTYTAQDLKDFSMMGKGGASLAPINARAKGGVPARLVAKVNGLRAQIKSGALRVDINEAQPSGSVSVKGKQ